MKKLKFLVVMLIISLTMSVWSVIAAHDKNAQLAGLSIRQREEMQKGKQTIEQLQVQVKNLSRKLELTRTYNASQISNQKAEVTGQEPVKCVQAASVNALSQQGQGSQTRLDENKTAKLLEQYYYSEQKDYAWAGRTEEKMLNLFKKANPGNSQLLDSSCRSTMCRIEISHPSPEAEQAFIAAITQTGAVASNEKQGLYHAVKEADGGVRSLFFYSRNGYDLSEAIIR